jgi:Fis family transcriptional regulator
MPQQFGPAVDCAGTASATNEIAMEPLTALSIPPDSAHLPLRECVLIALERYFTDLDGEPPGDLYNMFLTEVERPLLRAVMEHTGGNQTQAAAALGINRGTLRKKLRHYGLD